MTPELHITQPGQTAQEADAMIAEGYAEGKFRQCSLGYHAECSDPEGERCACDCHLRQPKAGPRVFWLVRDFDVTGISGTGIVAEGIEFSDGTTVLRWLPAGTTRPDRVKPTTVIHESVQSVINLHGHDNRTWVQFATDIVWPPEGEGRPERGKK